MPTSNQSYSSAFSTCALTCVHTKLPESISSFCSICSSRLVCGMNKEKVQDDCITVSPHCCICHMDTRDYHWVRGQVKSSNTVPDTRGSWGGRQSCSDFFWYSMCRGADSPKTPNIYRVPRETQWCKEVLYLTGILFSVLMLCTGHYCRL